MAAGDAWDPQRYHRFRDERRRPFDDLLGLLSPVPGGRIVDLGCGTGELTAAAHARLGTGEALGIDSSPSMLADAAGLEVPGLRFAAGDLAGPPPDPPWDVVLANASLHWAEDHPAVLGRWRAALAPGGQLAVQVPANRDHPSHATIREVLAEPPFDELLEQGPPDPLVSVLDPAVYAEVLWALGAQEQLVRLQVYGNEMPSVADVVEWTSGTALVPVRAVLAPAAYEAFVARYAERLAEHLHHAAPYYYAFKRILMWARFP